MFISGIYSLGNELNITENGLSTGSVDIEIKEYNNDAQPFDEDGSMVMPGSEIILIPRINNLGMDCYLRAKIEYTINNEEFPITDYIEGNYLSWTKKDDYYYYDSIFSKKSSIDLFNKVNIPNVGSEYNGKLVVVHIIVEAVQSKNFDGNWNNVNVIKSVDRAYDIDYEGESSIIYEDNTNKHITLSDKFFNKLGNMLPGDSVKEKVVLLNKGDTENNYYLSIDYDNLSNEELELLKKVKLSIKNQNGEEIVNSDLSNKNKYNLGIYKTGEGNIFNIEVLLPKETTNEFSKLYTKIKWIFSYESTSDEEIKGDDIINPITGDFGINIYITVFILSAIGFVVTLFLYKKETENTK